MLFNLHPRLTYFAFHVARKKLKVRVLAEGTIVTARARGASSCAKGLSVFFVPAKRNDGTSNYAVRRLKEKLGTISVPTGEVEM